MITALATLLFFQLLGETLVYLTGLPIPGPVVGLALLLPVMAWQKGWMATVRPTAQTLLQHLSLLFVPAGVGVMQHLRRIGDEALAIGVALVLSTWIGLLVTAFTLQWLLRRRKEKDEADQGGAAP